MKIFPCVSYQGHFSVGSNPSAKQPLILLKLSNNSQIKITVTSWNNFYSLTSRSIAPSVVTGKRYLCRAYEMNAPHISMNEYAPNHQTNVHVKNNWQHTKRSWFYALRLSTGLSLFTKHSNLFDQELVVVCKEIIQMSYNLMKTRQTQWMYVYQMAGQLTV